MKRLVVVIAAGVLLALGTGACSEVVNAALESAIRQALQDQGIDVQDLQCSSGVQGNGAGVTCSGTSGGQQVEAVGTVTTEGSRQAQLVITLGENEVVNRTISF